MIVVGILSPSAAANDLVSEIARQCAAAGARTEVIGSVPPDSSWDAVTFELAKAGVGHATLVRSALGTVEPADLELALRYLPDVRAIVLVRPSSRLLPSAAAAADWAGATLVLVGLTAEGDADTVDLVTEPIVIEPPDDDVDGTFAGFVARLATELDAGQAPADAWQRTVGSLAVDRID